MLMLCSSDHVKVVEQAAAQTILWQHAANGDLHQGLRFAGLEVLCDLHSTAARMPAEALVFLVGHFGACKADLVGIDHDHMIPTVHMRCERGLVLAAHDHRHFAGEPAKYFIFSIHDQPILLNGGLVGHAGGISRRSHWEWVYFGTSRKTGCEDRSFSDQSTKADRVRNSSIRSGFLQDPEFATNFLKCGKRFIDMRFGMRRAQLNADPCLILRNYRKEEADHIDAFL